MKKPEQLTSDQHDAIHFLLEETLGRHKSKELLAKAPQQLPVL